MSAGQFRVGCDTCGHEYFAKPNDGSELPAGQTTCIWVEYCPCCVMLNRPVSWRIRHLIALTKEVEELRRWKAEHQGL